MLNITGSTSPVVMFNVKHYDLMFNVTHYSITSHVGCSALLRRLLPSIRCRPAVMAGTTAPASTALQDALQPSVRHSLHRHVWVLVIPCERGERGVKHMWPWIPCERGGRGVAARGPRTDYAMVYHSSKRCCQSEGCTQRRLQ